MRINSIETAKFEKKTRIKKNIRFLIIHYTGMQSARVSIKRLLDSRFKVSTHYMIDRNGVVFKMVDDNKVAWHAGKSKWKNCNNLNKYSIGIEIQNKGHFKNYQKYKKNQINSLVKLIKILMKKYKIQKENVLGHSDIAPLRKLDPGEKFPWELLSKKGISIWFTKLNLKKHNLKFKDKRKFFFKNIFKIGYRYFSLTRQSKKDKFIIKAFQRRFLPKQVNGKLTQKTLQISHLLAQKEIFS